MKLKRASDRPAAAVPVYSSVTHFSETSRFPVLSLCLLLVPYVRAAAHGAIANSGRSGYGEAFKAGNNDEQGQGDRQQWRDRSNLRHHPGPGNGAEEARRPRHRAMATI